MELTQRIACTINEASASFLPEQVAFLGICGQKYPVMKGPNKIGRDPDTCNIVLKLNSISRHHAVINALNDSEYMLMDLNSANKTKLENKILDPYIPYSLRNGNMVQLGDVFGIFRLLHDDSDLPVTQTVEIPETPIATRHMSKLNNVHHHTTVPESPDVSDKDDSFIMPSQPKIKQIIRNHNNTCKTGKPMSVPQVGTKKIDNAYWNSSRKSDSLNLQSNTSGNSSCVSINSLECNDSNDIHELNTQNPNDMVKDEIKDDLISVTETSISENRRSLNIYDMETQVHVNENLPIVCKIQDQQNLAFDFFTNKKEDNSIFEAETQNYNENKPESPVVEKKKKSEGNLPKEFANRTQDTSNDIIIFEEVESPPVVEIFESQALLTMENDIIDKDLSLSKKGKTENNSKRNMRLNASASSADCDDADDDIISLSQNVLQKRTDNDDDLTDCEDDAECQKETIQKPDADDDLTDCEDDLFLEADKTCNKSSEKVIEIPLEDLPTQIVADDLPSENTKNDVQFEDMLTQVIEVVPQNEIKSGSNIEDILTLDNENKHNIKPVQFQTNQLMSPFKVPQSPMKSKRDGKNIPKQQIPVVPKSKVDDNFYASTQEVFEDLCSQREAISVGVASHEAEEIMVIEKLDVAKPTKTGSDSSSSDVEKTPKKLRPLTFMETDLPDSQEIRSSVTLKNRHNTFELSSESDTENDSQQCTPILFRHKKKKSNDAKLNLTKKMEIDALPTRIITRVRKPTSKAISNTTKNILKPKFLTEQEENIDKDIITENISRLKSKAAKPKSKDKNTKADKTQQVDDKRGKSKRSTSRKDVGEKSKKKTNEKNTEKNQDSNKEVLNKTGRHSNNSSLDKLELSSRSTRSRGRPKKADKKSTSPEIIKAKSNKSDQNDIIDVTADSRVRRSARQKNKDEGQRISKENEKSTIYNASSESSLDSSNTMKRSADFQFPSAKKTKTSPGSNKKTSKYTIDTQYVLFTAFPNEDVKNKLESLGAVITNDVMSCTVVLTLQIKRTFKFLCAVGLGRPIVGPLWVQACADANCIVDPNQYILKDEAAEQRFQFDLQKTIRGQRNFLKGYKVSCTPKVTPNAQELKAMVECSGGAWKEGGKNWLCVSCSADRPLWPQYKRKGAIVVSTELILAGVLRQKLDLEGNRLM